MTPPNASPQPILPGVPVPFPCWILVTYRPLAASHPYWHYQDSETDILCYTHYLVAPATADPATFPKAEQTEAERLLAVAQSLDDGTEPGTHRPAPTEKRLGEAQRRVEELADMLMRESRALGIIKASECDLRAQLATSQARLVEVEGERDAYRAVMVQVVPGEHGEGVEQPASPEHIKAHIDYLQKEWDGAEAALAQAKQEGAKLTTGLHELASRTETDAMEIGALMTENGSLRDALDKARNGLAWYRAEHPEDESPADDEMAEEIAQALLSNTSLTAQVDDLSAQLQAGEADKRRLDALLAWANNGITVRAQRYEAYYGHQHNWLDLRTREELDAALRTQASKGAGS